MAPSQPAAFASYSEQQAESQLDGNSSAYLEELYERYLESPQSIPEMWQTYFHALKNGNGYTKDTPHSPIRQQFKNFSSLPGYQTHGEEQSCEVLLDHDKKQVRVLQLINAYRFSGHLNAKINPLGNDDAPYVPELTLASHELGEEDLDKKFQTGSLTAPDEMTLAQILEQLRQTYCGSIGAQYMHVEDIEVKRWIQRRLESVRSAPEYTKSQRRYILDRITAAETLERYLHSRYVGQKRFSLEGAETLIPLLDALIQDAGATGVKEVVIGMAHRGRLNTLVNILGKSPAMLFKEFEGTHSMEDRTGDVKYHMGYSSDMMTPGGPLHVALAFNPSHLEIVGPVVEGAVRARQEHWRLNSANRVLPIVIHGDAAFAGQGVVMETLNMSETRGFKTHGTVRIIINNQIGFTTSTTRDARSTYYCSDVAKMVNAPVFHVNADDPEAVIFVTQLALEYRMHFHKDIVIDLVCYRRHGHNEADEPAATQPRMYKKIRALPTTREIYAKRLIEAGVVNQTKADDMIRASRNRLEEGHPVVPHLLKNENIQKPFPVDWQRFIDCKWQTPADTHISEDDFCRLGHQLATLPDGFEPHPRVANILKTRHQIANNEQPADWGFGEMLAYASLLEAGFPIRLSGQDSERGTFFHRHAVVHDKKTGKIYTTLKNLSLDQAKITIINSLLSEEAVLAFEYGYATTEPDTLVIWEAQFGDFANGAQVVIDQFISSGEQKWGRLSGLTMFLPHGFEGMGPEHSSARLERYLQLCAQYNLQVCIPTTPAQTFHMLRRQILRPYRKPLIVMTPKSLLRHPLATSETADFTQGSFKTVIDEVDDIDSAKVTRLVLCSGKVYYDLLERRRKDELNHVAVIRVEQPYPFPDEELSKIIARYPNVTHNIWCQEEPMNQGAWFSQQHHYRRVFGGYARLELASRPASASPAVGNLRVHRQQQTQVVEQALGITENQTA